VGVVCFWGLCFDGVDNDRRAHRLGCWHVTVCTPEVGRDFLVRRPDGPTGSWWSVVGTGRMVGNKNTFFFVRVTVPQHKVGEPKPGTANHFFVEVCAVRASGERFEYCRKTWRGAGGAVRDRGVVGRCRSERGPWFWVGLVKKPAAPCRIRGKPLSRGGRAGNLGFYAGILLVF